MKIKRYLFLCAGLLFFSGCSSSKDTDTNDVHSVGSEVVSSDEASSEDMQREEGMQIQTMALKDNLHLILGDLAKQSLIQLHFPEDVSAPKRGEMQSLVVSEAWTRSLPPQTAVLSKGGAEEYTKAPILSWTLITSLQQELGEELIVVDVRTPEEYDEKHLEGAINIPLQDLEQGGSDSLDPTKIYIVYCRSGRRSEEAGEWLLHQGFSCVLDAGGMRHIEEPVKR